MFIRFLHNNLFSYNKKTGQKETIKKHKSTGVGLGCKLDEDIEFVETEFLIGKINKKEEVMNAQLYLIVLEEDNESLFIQTIGTSSMLTLNDDGKFIFKEIEELTSEDTVVKVFYDKEEKRFDYELVDIYSITVQERDDQFIVESGESMGYHDYIIGSEKSNVVINGYIFG